MKKSNLVQISTMRDVADVFNDNMVTISRFMKRQKHVNKRLSAGLAFVMVYILYKEYKEYKSKGE